MTDTHIDICLVRAPGLRAWLTAAGYDRSVHVCERVPEEFDGLVVLGDRHGDGSGVAPESALAWQPRTFKDVMARALAVAAAVGCSDAMMAVVAAGETRLKLLRDRIGIDRKAPVDGLPRCVIRVEAPEGDIMPGLWVPDLVDRAAGVHALLGAGAPDESFPTALPDAAIQVITLPAAVMRPGPHLYDMVGLIAAQIHPSITS